MLVEITADKLYFQTISRAEPPSTSMYCQDNLDHPILKKPSQRRIGQPPLTLPALVT